MKLCEAKINGLDIISGLEKFENDDGIYRKILRSYAAAMRRILGQVAETEPRPDTLQSFRSAYHSIKGMSYDIYAGDIGDAAKALEQAAKDGNIETVRIRHKDLIAASGCLLEEIDNLLDMSDTDHLKPVKDKPGIDALNCLLEACRSYNMNAVHEAIQEISKYRYNADDGLAQWLEEKVDLVDYGAIIKRLPELLQKYT